MMDKNKICMVGAVLFFCSILCSGCMDTTPSGSTVDPRFVGKWVSEPFLGLNINYEFSSDGSVILEGEVIRSGTWNTNGDILNMMFDNETDGFTFSGAFEFEFSESNTKVELLYKSVVITLHKA